MLALPGVEVLVLEATDGAADGKQEPIRVAQDKTIHLQNSYVFVWGGLTKTTARETSRA